MKSIPTNEIKNAISQLTGRIEKLKKLIDICEGSNKLYNQLMIERAGLRMKLKEQESKKIVAFLYNKIEPRYRSKRICDFFKS